LLSFDSGIAAIKANIESYDMKELLGAISSHNINDKQLKGKIKAQLNTQISTRQVLTIISVIRFSSSTLDH
jgi:hypothetical protein